MEEDVTVGGLLGKSIVSVDDMSIADIEAVFAIADDIRAHWDHYYGKASGRIAATLFYEPSTRTRLSFEAAMQRLGGGVISTWDVNASSVVKGESLADTARVVGGYADVMVVRHPWDGAAKLAAEYSPVPVINAGDGKHEHPTQTLCDLYTLREHHGGLRGLRVALCGDLLHGRTVHSLAFALARFGANIIFVPGEGNEMPGYVLRRLAGDYHAHIQREQLGVLSALFDTGPASGEGATVDAIYITPREPHQLAMSSIEGTTVQFQVSSGEALSIYVTRRQKERGNVDSGRARYPIVTPETLKASQFRDISILHPLPRVDELSPDVDNDPRSLYFKQAALGVPVRMALIWHILGLGEEGPVGGKRPYLRSVEGLVYAGPGFDCSNETCVTNQERRFTHPQFEVVRDSGYKLRCLYCDLETAATHVGNTQSHIYYPSELLDRIMPSMLPEHVRFFRSSDAAEAAGFRKVADAWDKYHPEHAKGGGSWLDMVRGRQA
ncbi:MAG: hypothetical protein HYX93_04505 [Chloroflexi bacterium]|nr:hypothetical protein [Chloroflexota bacterium]